MADSQGFLLRELPDLLGSKPRPWMRVFLFDFCCEECVVLNCISRFCTHSLVSSSGLSYWGGLTFSLLTLEF